MMTTGWIGAAFAGVGLCAAFLMMWLWGFPYDEARDRSSAPRWLAWTHRGLGYFYITILLFMMHRMVPRIWLYPEEFSPLAAIHGFLGFVIVAVVLVKVAVVLAFPVFRKNLPVFGIPLLMLTLAMILLVIVTPVHEWRLSKAKHQMADAAAASLRRLPGGKTRNAADLLSSEGFASGRRLFGSLCTQCHSVRRVISTVKTSEEWRQTVWRMSDKIAAPEYRRMDEETRWAILAYLTAIRGKPAAKLTANPERGETALSTKAEPMPGSGKGTAEVPDNKGFREPASMTKYPASENDLEQKAMALFSSRCAVCHSGSGAPKGVRLDSSSAARSSGAVVPGNPASSELIRRVKGERLPRMPLGGPPYLTPEEIGILEQWVESLEKTVEKAEAAQPSADTRININESSIPGPSPAMPGPGEPVLFSNIQPVLIRNCVRCHSTAGIMGAAPEGLMLSEWEGVLRTSERPVVLPGNPLASLLLRHMRGLEKPRMPFDGPPWLTEAETGLIQQWIQDGARNADGRKAPVPVAAKVRLRGRLTSQWAIDGATFHVTGVTELRDIQIGGEVELRARVSPDGSLTAERVRGR
jgi:mono/diheme cytochrome c family protein